MAREVPTAIAVLTSADDVWDHLPRTLQAEISEEATERPLKLGQEDVNKRWATYSRLAAVAETQ
jgi:hypothetical protein